MVLRIKFWNCQHVAKRLASKQNQWWKPLRMTEVGACVMLFCLLHEYLFRKGMTKALLWKLNSKDQNIRESHSRSKWVASNNNIIKLLPTAQVIFKSSQQTEMLIIIPLIGWGLWNLIQTILTSLLRICQKPNSNQRYFIWLVFSQRRE